MSPLWAMLEQLAIAILNLNHRYLEELLGRIELLFTVKIGYPNHRFPWHHYRRIVNNLLSKDDQKIDNLFLAQVKICCINATIINHRKSCIKVRWKHGRTEI